MTIVASGEISLGVNATVTRSVACELGLPGTSTICMNQAAVRTLAGVPSGQISFSNFYSKSNVPPGPTTIGQVYCGGYYFGTNGSYYLVLSPNASGCACCTWYTTTNCLGAYNNKFLNTTDGWANNRTDAMTGAAFPSGNFTATRSINGYSDWFLPSTGENTTMYNTNGSMPAGQQMAASTIYRSSTRAGNTLPACNYATVINSGTGVVTTSPGPTFPVLVRIRAIRRQPM